MCIFNVNKVRREVEFEELSGEICLKVYNRSLSTSETEIIMSGAIHVFYISFTSKAEMDIIKMVSGSIDDNEDNHTIDLAILSSSTGCSIDGTGSNYYNRYNNIINIAENTEIQCYRVKLLLSQIYQETFNLQNKLNGKARS